MARHKHGEARAGRKTAEYQIWKSMRARCQSPPSKAYKWYGARGIKVCERWQDYSNFIADVGRRPSLSHSIERRDNNGDYCLENCYWASRREQASNRRNNFNIKAYGQTKTLAQWAKISGVSANTIWNRLKRRDMSIAWTPEKAIFTPPWAIHHRPKK